MGRNTQGVTLIRLSDGEMLTEIEAIQALEDSGEMSEQDTNSAQDEPVQE